MTLEKELKFNGGGEGAEEFGCPPTFTLPGTKLMAQMDSLMKFDPSREWFQPKGPAGASSRSSHLCSYLQTKSVRYFRIEARSEALIQWNGGVRTGGVGLTYLF